VNPSIVYVMSHEFWMGWEVMTFNPARANLPPICNSAAQCAVFQDSKFYNPYRINNVDPSRYFMTIDINIFIYFLCKGS
jgi:hypothetical protein